MTSSTSTPVLNQVSSRYCPATIKANDPRSYFNTLRYAPRDLRMKNVDTSIWTHIVGPEKKCPICNKEKNSRV